jgi:hypothetical protein
MTAIVLPNHAYPACRQLDGGYKKTHATKEAADSFELAQRERFPEDKPQYAYQCDLGGDELPQPHFHLTTEEDEPLPESIREAFVPVIPISYEEFEGKRVGRLPGSTHAHVERRRERVLKALQNDELTYPELAAELEIPIELFKADVQALRNEGLYAGRNASPRNPSPLVKAPTLTAAQQLTALENAEKELQAKKEALRALVQAEEAARIEREKVHVEWVVEYPDKEIQVRKKGRAVHFGIDAWREIIKAVSEEVGRFDRNEITFTAFENAVNGTILAGPRAGHIHEDYRR